MSLLSSPKVIDACVFVASTIASSIDKLGSIILVVKEDTSSVLSFVCSGIPNCLSHVKTILEKSISSETKWPASAKRWTFA
jgi:hypothetical protein